MNRTILSVAAVAIMAIPSPVLAADLGIAAEEVVSAAVWPDGHVAVLHESASGRLLTRFDASGNQVWQVAVSAEARNVRIPTAGTADVVILNASDGHTVYVEGVNTMSGSSGAGLSAAGTYLLRSEAEQLVVREVSTGAVRLSLPLDVSAQERDVFQYGFGLDDRSLIISGADPIDVDITPDPREWSRNPQWIQTFDLVSGERVIRRPPRPPEDLTALTKDTFVWVDRRSATAPGGSWPGARGATPTCSTWTATS